jgi:hypothetical protein
LGEENRVKNSTKSMRMMGKAEASRRWGDIEPPQRRPQSRHRRSGTRRLSIIGQAAGAFVVVMVLLLWGLGGLAAASVTEGGQVPDSAVATGTFTPDTPFASGQNINISVPANSVFASGAGINILECEYQGALPTSPSQCDGNTIQGSTITANSDGSIDYTGYTIYALPDKVSLGESSGPPFCNLSNSCVLYIGENQNDFTQPHVWSQTFWVAPNSTDSGSPAGDGSAPPPPTAPDPSKSTVTASSTVTCPSGLSPSPSACAEADGNSPVTVTVTLLDSSSSPVPGKTVELTGSSGNHSVVSPFSPGSNVSGSNGEATFKVTDSTAENVSYTATDTTDTPNVTVTQTIAVDFLTPSVSASLSTVVANPTSVAANGSTPSTITVTLVDEAGQPLSGKEVTLAASGGSSTISPSTPQTTTSSGVATFTVTDTANEAVTYTATDKTDSIPLTSKATVTFGTLSVSASDSTVIANGAPGVAIAAFGENVPVSVTLLTSAATPVQGKEVTLSASGGSSTISPNTPQTTSSSGAVSFTVTDNTAETVTYSAKDTTDDILLDATAQVQFEASAPSASASTVTCSDCTGPADGSTPIAVDVHIVDQFGNAEANQTIDPHLTDASGNARAAAQGTSNGAPVTDAQGNIAFDVVDTSAETVTFAAVPADGKTASTITVTLLDNDGNAVPGKAVILSASGGSSKITPASATSNSAGNATFSVTDTANEEVTYTATDTSDTPQETLEATVVVTFGTPPPVVPAIADSVLTSSGTTAPANGSTSVTIMVVLADSSGDPVSTKTVVLNPSGGSSTISPATTATTDADGEAKFSVSDTTAQTVTYTAADKTDDLPITGQSVTVTFTPSTSTQSTTTPTTTPGSSSSSGAGSGSSGSSGSSGTAATSSGSSTGGTGSTGGGSGSSSNPETTGASTDDSGSGSQLAYTGVPMVVPWLLGFGVLLFLVGCLGRRLSLGKS